MSTAPFFPVHEAGPAVDSAGPRRDRLARTVRRLAWLGLAWHLVEATVAIATGVVAGSVALVGFGGDSLIEVAAGLVVLWRFAERRLASESSERRAQQLIAVLFYLLALYVAADAIRTLFGDDHPAVSWVGIGLAAVTLATMPPLATAKARVARELRSSAGTSESRQTMLCAYLSAGLLVGLGLNAVAGWWWADPLTALAIAAIAAREGCEAWRGESCCTAPIRASNEACGDGCCGEPPRASDPARIATSP